MTNPVMLVRPTSLYGDAATVPRWRTCWMWCPGCDHACGIPVPGVDGTLPRTGPHWEWDGNVACPTFTPSILQQQGGSIPRCHSYVTAGRWVFLADCGHALAGQSADMVPLPDWMMQEQDR